MTELRTTSRLLIGVIVLGLIGGLGAGLVIGWVLWPVQIANVDATDLKPSAQEDLIVLIANTYAYDQELTRARERLAELKDPKISSRIAALAKKYAAQDNPDAAHLAALAVALGINDTEIALLATTATPTPTVTLTPTLTPTLTLTPTATRTMTPTATLTRTPTRPRVTATAKPAPVPPTAWIPSFPAEWPSGVKVEWAAATPGQKYWHLVKAVYCDMNDEHDYCQDLPGGPAGTGVYVLLLGSGGGRTSAPLIITKPDGSLDSVEEKSPTDMCNCSYSFAANGFPVRVGGAPSDTISGLALYSVKAKLSNFHCRYFLTFQYVTK